METKKRPNTATNRANESLNNRYFPNIQNSNYQTKIYNQSQSFNNIIDPNDSVLNDQFASLLDLWFDLGVTNEYQNQFKNILLNLSNEEKETVIENEKKNLSKFKEALVKFTQDVSQREKNIQLLKKLDEIIETTFPEGNKQLNDSLLTDISNVIKALRFNSVNCVSSMIKLREISYFKSLNGKFNFKRMNKAYIYDNNYLLKMKNDMNFLQYSNLGKYINFSTGEIDPFLVCCSSQKNNRSKRQDKTTFPINDDLMKSIKQAKYYLIQDVMFHNIEEEKKNNDKSFTLSNFFNSNNNYKNVSSFNKSQDNNFMTNLNNNVGSGFNGSKYSIQGKTSFNKASRVGSAKTKSSNFGQSSTFKNINFNNLNMNRTLHKLKIKNGEIKYNLMFLNREQEFYKIQHQGNKIFSGNRSNFYKNNYNNPNYNENNMNQNNNDIILEESYTSNIKTNYNSGNNKKIKIQREQITMMSRDEFLKSLDMIEKEKEESYKEEIDKEESYKEDHSMSQFIEENKKLNEEERQKKLRDLEEKNRREDEEEEKREEEDEEKNRREEEEEKKKELSENEKKESNQEENKVEKNESYEEQYDEFEIDENEEEEDNNIRKDKLKNNQQEEEENNIRKEKLKNNQQEEEEEIEDYGGFENSNNEKLETNINDYKIEYYSKDIDNLIRNLTDKNYIDKIPEKEKSLFNLSEESFYPNNLIKGVYPKLLICYPKEENSENITALCNFSYSSFEKPIKILINHLSAINYNDKENSWESQIESLITFIKNNHEYDIIEINFNNINELDKNMKILFTQNLSFQIDEDNKKLYYKNPNSNNDIVDKFSKFLSIKTASLICYSIMATSSYFSNDKYINLFNLYYVLSEKKNNGIFSLKKTGEKSLLIDSNDIKNELDKNIIFSLDNNNFNSLKQFIKEKVSNEAIFDYLEYNGNNPNDLIVYNYIPALRSGISFKYKNYYYNRIEDNLEILIDESTNSKIYLIPTYEEKNKIIIAELNKNLKRKLLDKNGNIYENFNNLYNELSVDKDSKKNKIIFIPSFSLESRLSTTHVFNVDKNLRITNNNNGNAMYISSVDEFFKIEWNFENNLKNNISFNINKDDIIINDTFIFGIFNEKIFDLYTIPAIQLFIVSKDFWKT